MKILDKLSHTAATLQFLSRQDQQLKPLLFGIQTKGEGRIILCWCPAYVMGVLYNTGEIGHLKEPWQPLPFLMPSKLLLLHGEAKSYCFTVSCVPESMLNYLCSITAISFVSTCMKANTKVWLARALLEFSFASQPCCQGFPLRD